MKVKQRTETYIKYACDNGNYLKIFNVHISVHR